ncbi:MAG: peptidylprolyl isomerase [Methanomicrobiales archaeon]|nr:peptidylprolyl isomerase [Methanomicrobiales archaeon]
MKKSEKEKGQAQAEAQRKQILTVIGGAAIALVIIAVIGYVVLNPSGAKAGDTVGVYYTGTLDDGTQFDEKVSGTPLTFTIGSKRIIFEDEVIGMQQNATKTVHIPADKAYGPYRNDLIHVMNRSQVPADMELKVGERYSIRRTTDNAVAYVKVLNLTKDTVTWDENHELAGKDLTFTITLVGIARA